MKTKNDLLKMSRRELLELTMVARGKTGDDPKKPETYFRGIFDTDFSYNDVITRLKNMGAVNGWYFPDEQPEKHKDEEVSSDIHDGIRLGGADVIELRKLRKDEIKRQTYAVPAEISDEWADFTSVSTSKAILLGAAMRRFMADAKAGVIQVVQRWC